MTTNTKDVDEAIVIERIPWSEWEKNRREFARHVFGNPSQYDKAIREMAADFLTCAVFVDDANTEVERLRAELAESRTLVSRTVDRADAVSAALEDERKIRAVYHARAEQAEAENAKLREELAAKQRGYDDLHEMLPGRGDIWSKVAKLHDDMITLSARAEGLKKQCWENDHDGTACRWCGTRWTVDQENPPEHGTECPAHSKDPTPHQALARAALKLAEAVIPTGGIETENPAHIGEVINGEVTAGECRALNRRLEGYLAAKKGCGL